MQNSSQTCPYCYPEKPNHRHDKTNSLFFLIQNFFTSIFNVLLFNKPLYFTDKLLVRSLIKGTENNKIQMKEEADLSQMTYRLKLLWQEAKERNLKIYCFSYNGRQLLAFLLTHNEKKYYFHYTPTTLLHKNFKQFKDPTIYDDKITFKKLLAKNNILHPEGKVFFSKKNAFNYGKKMGFPLVVKPNSSSLSKHVTLNINDDNSLKSAIDIAKIIDHKIIVERFIPGDVHRFMFLGDKLLVCSKRTRPSIIGDGKSTVDALIDKFNSNPLRGNKGKENFALSTVEKNKLLQKCLADQGVNLKLKLGAGKKIFLAEKTNCSNGAEVINLTEDVCDENVELFRKTHHSLKIAVSAIDFICSDISKPWHSQPFGMLENNSFPDISPQHFPSSGTPVNVAKAIWGFVIENLDKKA
ncbi:MAG: hypothetical protein NTZ67_07685 [Gammaproteobacteria bacterium]|nr:hypothetical protein [Gammaproteobacteria bacterium]